MGMTGMMSGDGTCGKAMALREQDVGEIRS